MHRFQSFLKASMSALTIFSGILLLLILGVTVCDVVMRNLIGKSIIGTVDLSSLLLVTIAFLGLASAELENRHVSVDLIERVVGERTKFLFAILRLVLFTLIALIVSWGLFTDVLSAYNKGDATNGILRITIWPTKLVLLLSFLFYFFVLLFNSFVEVGKFKSDLKTADKDSIKAEHNETNRADVKIEGNGYGTR